MNMGRISCLVVGLSLCSGCGLVSCSNYRNWYHDSKPIIDRGKVSLNNILESVKGGEEECKLLNPSRSIAGGNYNNDSTQKPEDQYPCITALTKSDDFNFDINLDVYSLARGETKYQVAAQGGCWHYVLKEIEGLDVDKCGIKGEASRALIALAKTKCHFLRSNRPFPDAKDGCILNPRNLSAEGLNAYQLTRENNPCNRDYNSESCEDLKDKIVSKCTDTKVMSSTAFSMYHADLNHIDDICFYLQSHEWNRRTEANINRLGEATNQIMDSHKQIEGFLDNFEHMQKEQLDKANVLSRWMDSLKTDMSEVFTILYMLKDYQAVIYDFVHHSRNILVYLLYALGAFFLTSFESTTSIRPLVILVITSTWLLEGLSFNVIHGWIKFPEEISPIIIYDIWSKALRWFMTIAIAVIWGKAIIRYRNPLDTIASDVDKLVKAIETQQQTLYQIPKQYPFRRQTRYTLEDIVQEYDSSEDETFENDAGSDASSCSFNSYDLGEDSEELVDEYLSSRGARRRKMLLADE